MKDKPKRKAAGSAPSTGDTASKRPSPDRMADAVFEKPLRHSEYRLESRKFFIKVAPTVAFGVALFVLLQNLNVLSHGVKAFIGAMAPVIVGIALAFILNVPLRIFETRVFFFFKSKSVRRGLSILLCYMLLCAFLLTLIFVVLPQLGAALQALSSMLPMLGNELYSIASELVYRYGLDESMLKYLEFDWNAIAMNVIEWATASLPQLVNTTRDITGRMMEIFIGFIMSVYMMFGKERLSRQGCRLCRAIFPADWAERVINICRLTQTTLRRYMTGMLTESCILGTLTAIGMAIFRFPSPVFAGVIMGIGALIPIFGIFITTVVNALLIAVQADISTALWFVVYIIVLQQLEGNLIYPRVMGSAIRLPGIWVLAAATVGGTLFGLPGLLLSVPIVSIFYSLVRAFVLTRERTKSVGKGE